MVAYDTDRNEKTAWLLDQVTKSEFFHQKLHEYGLLTVADAIVAIDGAALTWDLESLSISESAWKKIIHRGIKPVTIFAHPEVLVAVNRSVGYYQKLAMVSLKSMSRIGLPINRYVAGGNKRPLAQEKAESIARRLNTLVSRLIESEEEIEPREFALWRAMTAGSTAQGSWQNRKGDAAEELVKGFIRQRIQKEALAELQDLIKTPFALKDGRSVEYGSEPDIAFYDAEQRIAIAIEIKGGIDQAGILERIGAALKSLSRAKQENPAVITILILYAVSMTAQARLELQAHQDEIDHWYTIEDILNRADIRQELFTLCGLDSLAVK